MIKASLAGIKDLLVSQGQAPFARRFASASRSISHAASNTQLIGLAPRYPRAWIDEPSSTPAPSPSLPPA